MKERISFYSSRTTTDFHGFMANERSPFLTNVLSQGERISDNWRPSASLCQQLEAKGLNRYFIQGELRRQFILSHQQQEVRNGNWESLFAEFALQRSPTGSTRTTAPNERPPNTSTELNSSTATSRNTAMSDDWRPSDAMVELILGTICANKEYLKAQLISFTSHFHGQYNPNWDQQFKKWINNGWNVYGHKNNFGKKQADDRGFVEKHTDKSWRDGL